MTDLTGRTLGPYELHEEIGHGGMANVYRAVQPSIGREVAVKVLPAHFLQDRTFVERFTREVKVIAKLQHSHILPVYDFGEQDGIPYIVMAYMPGGTLADRIRREGGLPLDEVARLVEQIAAGLDFAHKKGVIHRDFKPSNVLLDEAGNVHLADFGIAKVTEATAQLTGSGIVGTPAYMAPEMSTPEGLSPLVDVYALGVTLFQMLTGRQPYDAPTPLGVLMAHANQPIPDARLLRPDLPDSTQSVVEGAMAKDPAERYQSAGALAADLRAAASVGAQGLVPLPAMSPPAPPADTPDTELAPPMDEAAPDARTVDVMETPHPTRSARQSRATATRKRTAPASARSGKPGATLPRKAGWQVWVLIGGAVLMLGAIGSVVSGNGLFGLGLAGVAPTEAETETPGITSTSVEVPENVVEVGAEFGGEILLLGFTATQGDQPVSLNAVVPGPVIFTMYWQALSRPAGDYNYFVHVSDAQGNIIAQHDDQSSVYPTSAWNAGEIVTSVFTIEIPTGQTGLEFYVGMYSFPSLERLPAMQDGSQTPDSRIRLPVLVDADTPISTSGEQARQLATAGVTRNADWTPYKETINSVDMVLVPAGCFPMGSEDGSSDEQPVHEVCFEVPFWIDAYEVTQAQFAQFGGQAAEASYFTGDNLPRENITWYEAEAFCALRGARLPTEAEWEYAARGPDGLTYPWGNEFIADNVVYEGNSEGRPWDVGSRPGGVSWVGAFDMTGNVWEWVNDWFSVSYYGTLADGTVNPQGPGSGDDRVLRGGSSLDGEGNLRAALRNWTNGVNRNYYVGFRCALSY